jgi:phospholipid N-methyltransferase
MPDTLRLEKLSDLFKFNSDHFNTSLEWAQWAEKIWCSSVDPAVLDFIFHGLMNKITNVSNAEGQKEQVDFIEKYTRLEKLNDCSIIEIGPGNGVMAERLLERNSDKIKRLVLVDGAPPLELCLSRLKKWKQVEYKIPEDLQTLEGNFNLLISCHCLPECTIDYQNFIYNTFFPRIDEMLLVQTITKEYSDRKPNHKLLIDHIKLNFKKFDVFSPWHKEFSKNALRANQKIIWAVK